MSKKENPLFLEVIADEMRFRNFEEQTIKSYMQCYREFVRHFYPRHPRLLTEDDIGTYLDHLSAAKRPAARLFEASAALKFLYGELYQKRFSFRWPREEEVG